MITITKQLTDKIHEAGFNQQTIAPLAGLTAATFSFRVKGRVPWELNECYAILDALNIPRSEITQHFTGGILPQNRRWK